MLLLIGDRTVIGILFDALERNDHIEDIYVSTNEKFADDFRSYIDKSGYDKPQLSVEETTAEDEKFGVVVTLAQLFDREDSPTIHSSSPATPSSASTSPTTSTRLRPPVS